jgi:hypothetical protein
MYYRIHEKLVQQNFVEVNWARYMKISNINACHYDSLNLAMLDPTSNLFRLST